MPGPTLRTDIVDVYVFRREPQGPAFLQLRRTTPPLAGTWQPVMGHIEPDETATRAALRELAEETSYAPSAGLLGMWQLETPNIFFMAPRDAMLISPCFAAEVDITITPTLDHTHDQFRWIGVKEAQSAFLWPGQRHAVAQILRDILPSQSPSRDMLAIDLPTV